MNFEKFKKIFFKIIHHILGAIAALLIAFLTIIAIKVIPTVALIISTSGLSSKALVLSYLLLIFFVLAVTGGIFLVYKGYKVNNSIYFLAALAVIILIQKIAGWVLAD